MLRRLLPAVTVALLAMAMLGCDHADDSDSPARYGLTVNLLNMTPHVGQNFYLRVWHVGTGVEVGRTWVRPIVTPNFTVTVPDVLIAGESYYVDFFADLNMSGTYNAPPVDHAWRRIVGPVTGETSLTFTHDVNWTDIQYPNP